ncbi:MAG: aldo/keto reductase [Spirochaetales bacterium]|nr:aldo/keto reductase [Spirochaetales bacterium]
MIRIEQTRQGLSALGMGCWGFGGDYWKKQSRDLNRKTLVAALRKGISHFDTAPAYGNGESEQILGQLLHKELLKGSPERRASISLTSKFFPTLPQNVYKGLARSLKRLMTDYLDVYYLHWPNDKCDIQGIMGELERARAEGLIRAVGVSNFTLAQMEKVNRYGRIDFCQTGYSLLWRYPEKEIIPWCMQEGVKVIAYSPLAQGLLKTRNLNKQYRDGTATRKNSPPLLFPAGDPRRQLIFFRDEEGLLDVLNAFEEVISPLFTLQHGSLNWLKGREGIKGVLAGMRNPDQVQTAGEAWINPLPEELVDMLDGISREYWRKLERINPDADNIWAHKR